MMAKMSKNTLLIVSLFLLSIFILRAPHKVFADVTHCGTIAANETWAAADNVHVMTCDVTVPAGVTLTIEEGAIVKAQADDSLIINGKLIAKTSTFNLL
ncbi:MAG: hypothetical protein H6660_05635 [Ardenticatenaceae bacterium]|nr:hypothetical protein [Ardenticatenaceae bacterium]